MTTPDRQQIRESGPLPKDPRRVRAFANYFKNYMGVAAVVTAALPIPVTALKLIPTPKDETAVLATYTPMFCFLVLAFIFYRRHGLTTYLFPSRFPRSFPMPPADRSFWSELRFRWPRFRFRLAVLFVDVLPLLLVVGCLASLFAYHYLMATFEDILLTYNPTAALMILYIAIFVTAESAFVLMAIKEYMQDLLGITDLDLLKARGLLSHARDGDQISDAASE